jgi:hypothetical protein
VAASSALRTRFSISFRSAMLSIFQVFCGRSHAPICSRIMSGKSVLAITA